MSGFISKDHAAAFCAIAAFVGGVVGYFMPSTNSEPGMELYYRDRLDAQVRENVALEEALFREQQSKGCDTHLPATLIDQLTEQQ